MKYDYTKYKVGDPLWSTRIGEVTIDGIDKRAVCYPIRVRSVDDPSLTATYTADGRHENCDKYPTLFPEMPKFPKQPERFEQDQIVSVKGKLRRYAMYSEGKHYVYMDGMSSKSSGHVYSNTFCAPDVKAVDLDRLCEKLP